MRKDMNRLLKSALAPSVVPDAELNQRLLEKAKNRNVSPAFENLRSERMEVDVMREKNKTVPKKRETKKRFLSPAMAAGITVCVLAAGSLTAVAAYRYLSPAQIAEEMGYEKLSDVFSGEEATLVNESQITGGYRVTLLGMTTGANLNPFYESDLEEGRTYAVLSIEKEDGTPMPELTAEDFQLFSVSPLIAGQNPMVVNAATLGAGVTGIVRDGVQYELVDCENLEKYGALGVYLSVTDSFGDITQSFVMDASDGSFSVDPGVTELAALFSLPLDPGKADSEAARKQLEQIAEDFQHPAQQTLETADTGETLLWQGVLSQENKVSPELAEFLAKVTEENYKSYLAPDESTRITLIPDAEGYASYDRGEGGESGTLWLGTPDTWSAEELEQETLSSSGMADTLDSLYAEMLTLHADGTATLVTYRPIL